MCQLHVRARRDLASASGPQPTLIPWSTCRDAEYGEVAGDPTSRVSPSIEQTWCTYIEPKSLQAWYAAFRLVAEQQAALLKGSPLLSGALPDLDDLVRDPRGAGFAF